MDITQLKGKGFLQIHRSLSSSQGITFY